MNDETTMLADMARLAASPHTIVQRLQELGYEVRPVGGNGWFARTPTGSSTPIVLLPLHEPQTHRQHRHEFIGRQVATCATVVATLTALREMSARPALLCLTAPTTLPPDLAELPMLSLEGGVVPRIWDGCFGSFDLLARLTAPATHPGEPNTGVNAIEESVPVLQALLKLKQDMIQRGSVRPKTPDAPLMPRVSISAAHGGFHGAVLPSMFDIIVSRRYDPGEDPDVAQAEIENAILATAGARLEVELSLSAHKIPVPDPDAGQRSRESAALTVGWGWPQVPFRTDAPMFPDATLFGGLVRPGIDPSSETATTSLDDMAALVRSLRTLFERW